MESDDDLLSDLLAPLRLHGLFHSRWSARAPWGVAGERENCAILHYVQEGECTVELPETAGPIRLHPGDLAVFPHGSAHRLADRPGRAAVPLDTVVPGRAPGAVRAVEIDGPGPVTTMLCGGLHYDGVAAAPLYRALPPVFVLDRVALARQPLLDGTLRRLAEEWTHAEPGGRLVALRAFELAFVLALRVALSELAPDEPVLRALRHPAISRALLAVHNRFAEPWTLESLAAEAGLSRSAFAATFRELVGESPMRHLTARRMQEAARLLTDTELTQGRIAERVGYHSGVGFHLAFRAWSGRTPGDYRRAHTPVAGRPPAVRTRPPALRHAPTGNRDGGQVPAGT
ncbi:AraC-like DNA-binding protein [Streptosporangium becharense]|uniref:AraC-like DNA-binding protein n=1 Tax=Streptosporangium becharense TaxID=1816182 RepID=A0A7W9IFC6_9ACTN|nr:AraC family transcriptional regulator [Streptosporangium becharense]MBB2909391.1 AraC-like DNA-binding protein [Streptosporangium becharense]MBB5819652.1 AraC-like DNA-binding protein [Streptosporangium becharense]